MLNSEDRRKNPEFRTRAVQSPKKCKSRGGPGRFPGERVIDTRRPETGERVLKRQERPCLPRHALSPLRPNRTPPLACAPRGPQAGRPGLLQQQGRPCPRGTSRGLSSALDPHGSCDPDPYLGAHTPRALGWAHLGQTAAHILQDAHSFLAPSTTRSAAGS